MASDLGSIPPGTNILIDTNIFVYGLTAQSAQCKTFLLENNPEQVKTLSDYWRNTERLLALNIVLLPMEKGIVVRAQIERANAGLLTNDSIICSDDERVRISRIATRDNQFDRVGGIVVFSQPTCSVLRRICGLAPVVCWSWARAALKRSATACSRSSSQSWCWK